MSQNWSGETTASVIVTSGGIIGEVVHLKENEVTIRSGEAKLVVMRSNIATILKSGAEAKSA